MSDKSEGITSLLDSFAERIGDLRVAAEHDAFRHEGAAKALFTAAAQIVELSVLVDDDLTKGRYDLDTGQRIKAFIMRAGNMLVAQAKHEQTNRLLSQGRAQGALDVARLAAKRREDEVRKAATAEPAHPGPTLKDERNMEEVETIVQMPSVPTELRSFIAPELRKLVEK